MTVRKILVIDDSMMIRKTIKDMLPPDRFQIIDAKDGLQGMELIRSSNPSVIILDFFLPKMSGWEIYQEIQKNPNYRQIPLLLISGRKDEVMEKITEPFEFFAFLEKPFDQKQLIQGIRTSMERSQKLIAYLKQSPAQEDNSSSQNTETTNNDIEQLKANVIHLQTELYHLKKQLHQVEQMETEITDLKKQLHQVVNFIKQKLK